METDQFFNKQKLANEREKIRRLFNTDPSVRADAFDALKAAWAYGDPSFRTDELSVMPLENCALMAARRDAYKEVIDWLDKI